MTEEFPKIGAPALRALNKARIKNLIQLTNFTEAEILALHGMGPKALRILKAALKKEKRTFKK